MWPIPRINHEIVTIGCTPTTLACAWIIQKKQAPCLMAYQTTPLPHLQLHNAQPFNPTMIGNHIVQFLQRYKLTHAFVSLWLDGPAIKQYLVTCSHAHPTTQELGIVDADSNVWEHFYLYPTADGRFVFYVVGISKKIIFQYQLLAISHRINLITLTSYQMTLLHLYRFIQGDTFRHTKLSYDIKDKNNQLDLLFTQETISRTLTIDPSVTISMADEFLLLLGMVGLFIMEIDNEKS
jgi:hypothetical protein